MPYLNQHTRAEVWDTPLSGICFDVAESDVGPGDLNYIFTKIALAYMQSRGLRYATLSEIIGAFECAKLEFYRRAVAPYEDKKIAENGDVY